MSESIWLRPALKYPAVHPSDCPRCGGGGVIRQNDGHGRQETYSCGYRVADGREQK